MEKLIKVTQFYYNTQKSKDNKTKLDKVKKGLGVNLGEV